jgi:hypothetical protein
MNRTFAICTVALLCGCAPRPLPQTNDADAQVVAGARPNQARVEELVLRDIRSKLKDPDSIKQFEVTAPTYINRPPQQWALGFWVNTMPRPQVIGWYVCAQYNAKNSYGAYAGVERRAYLLRSSASGEPYIYDSANGCT